MGTIDALRLLSVLLIAAQVVAVAAQVVAVAAQVVAVAPHGESSLSDALDGVHVTLTFGCLRLLPLGSTQDMHDNPNYNFDDLRSHPASSTSNLAEMRLEDLVIETLSYIKEVRQSPARLKDLPCAAQTMGVRVEE